MARNIFFYVLAFAFLQMAVNVYLLNLDEEKGVSISNPNDDFASKKYKRPWMIVHVGPPKTGTTTIQTGLTLNIPNLGSLDNIFYLGQSSSRVRKTPRIEYIQYSSDQKDYNNGTLSIFPAKYLFLGNKEMFETLKDYQKQKHNVLVSTEHFTSKFIPGKNKGKLLARIYRDLFLNDERLSSKPSSNEKRNKKMRKGQERSITIDSNQTQQRHLMDLKETNEMQPSSLYIDESSNFGFNVKIVVNYRHYFQWLPSYYFQSKLMNERSDGHTLREYIEEAIGSLGQDYAFIDGDLKNITWLQTIPSGLDKVHGTLWSYMQWSSPVSLRNRVEIFDLHQQQIIINDSEILEEYPKKSDLFHNFVCQALPDATETCSRVREANKTIVARAREESGQVSSLESGKLSDTQLYQLKFAGLEREESFISTFNVDPAQSIFRFKRVANKVEKLISANFYDWAERRRAAAYNDSHRQLCLSEESTLALKSISWNMLRHLEALVRIRDKEIEENGSEELKQLFRASEIHQPKHLLLLSPQKYNHEFISYRKDEGWWAAIKRNHDILFEKAVESGAYCELDLDSLFSDENFVKQIFFRTDDVRHRKNSLKYHKSNKS